MDVCAVLIQEHRDMEHLLEQFDKSLADLINGSGDEKALYAAKGLADTINQHIKVHFASEEQGLFPVLSVHHPMDLMELEHEHIIELKQQVDELLQRFNGQPDQRESLQTVGRQFIRELLDHIGREDHGIFPMAERDMNDSEKHKALKAMDAVHAEAETLPALEVPERGFKVVSCDMARLPEKDILLETLIKEPQVSVKELVLKPGVQMSTHRTMEPAALICLEGEGYFLAGEEKVLLTPGKVVVLDKRLLHSVEAVSMCRFCIVKWKAS